MGSGHYMGLRMRQGLRFRVSKQLGIQGTKSQKGRNYRDPASTSACNIPSRHLPNPKLKGGLILIDKQKIVE